MASEYLNNKVFENIISRFQQAKRERVKNELILEEMKERESRLKKRNNLTPWPTQEVIEKAKSDYAYAQAELAFAFYTLSENIVRYAKFNLIDCDDAVQEGVVICFEKIDKFDPSKGKAFNYMTTCILNHFRQLYRTARNYNELKRRYGNFLSERLEQALVKRKSKVPPHLSTNGN